MGQNDEQVSLYDTYPATEVVNS